MVRIADEHLRQNGVSTSKIRANAILPKGHELTMEHMYRDESLITIPYEVLFYDEIEEYEEVIANLTAEIEKSSNNCVLSGIGLDC